MILTLAYFNQNEQLCSDVNKQPSFLLVLLAHVQSALHCDFYYRNIIKSALKRIININVNLIQTASMIFQFSQYNSTSITQLFLMHFCFISLFPSYMYYPFSIIYLSTSNVYIYISNYLLNIYFNLIKLIILEPRLYFQYTNRHLILLIIFAEWTNC